LPDSAKAQVMKVGRYGAPFTVINNSGAIALAKRDVKEVEVFEFKEGGFVAFV
jgi:hypothetical protein